jgi:hypothetical protein
MSYNYKEAVTAYKNDDVLGLSTDKQGMRFLLLRSLSRAEHIERVASDFRLSLDDVPARQRLQALFESNISVAQIEQIIRDIYKEEREVRRRAESGLIKELYKMGSFDWGGLYQNSLEATIVDSYVKKIRSFEELNEKIEGDLFRSMRGYVQCSWYNHWTSILIEDVFKDHPSVLPAVGLVKKVDFFINDVPFDLKVTYLPEGFIKDKRKEKKLRPEASLLLKIARDLNLPIDLELPAGRLLEDLWKKVNDSPTKPARDLIGSLKKERDEILKKCVGNPEELIVWLYENQGIRRFDAANRLFLVLVNTNSFFESWKLKRARELLVEKIYVALSQRNGHVGITIKFNWEGEVFKAHSGAIFVTHSA